MKKFDLKSLIVGIIVGGISLGGIVTASTLVKDVYFNAYPVYVNGSYYSSTMPLLNYGGRTYVPLDEFGRMTGSRVGFSNNTIYVDSYNNSYGYNYNYDNSYNEYDDMELEVGEKDTFYVDLGKYNAYSATITYSGSYIDISKSSMYSSGKITVTGKREGDTTIRITYNTGKIDYIDVEVTDDEDEGELKIGMDTTGSYYIDLDDYDADKATLTYNSTYVKLSKTTFKSSGKVTITPKKVGETTVKIKYDTGDVENLYVTITDEYDYEDEIEVEKGDTEKYYINLKDYDADKATLTYNSTYMSLSKTTFTSSGNVTITGKKAGEAVIKVKYDTDDIDYIFVEVTDEDEDEEYYDELEVEKGETNTFYIDLEYFDADKATLTYDSDYIKLSKTTFNSSGRVTITGKKVGDTRIKIKYDTGDIEYVDVEIF